MLMALSAPSIVRITASRHWTAPPACFFLSCPLIFNRNPPTIPFSRAASQKITGNRILFPSGSKNARMAQITTRMPITICSRSRISAALRGLRFFSCPAINYTPSVAIITALMVCIRFSASSKTTDCSDSNTSSVTSSSLIPNFS